MATTPWHAHYNSASTALIHDKDENHIATIAIIDADKRIVGRLLWAVNNHQQLVGVLERFVAHWDNLTGLVDSVMPESRAIYAAARAALADVEGEQA